MKVTTEQLALLKEHGFKWYKDASTDRVEADYIADVIPAANGFTVLYNDKGVLYATTAVVKWIEVPVDLKGQWIYVHWDRIEDERK